MPNFQHMLSVVIPVYNETESLRSLHSEVDAALRGLTTAGYEIIFVDDGSTDRSFELCRDIQKEDPEHVRVIAFRRNFGQTAAMSAGFDHARGDVIIPMDADLQNDPADIPKLLAKLDEGFDVVSGWRANRQDKALSRKLPSMLANRLISWITGVHLHDYGCTLKAYRREVAEHINFYGELHRFLPALASWAGAKVAEIPVNHRSRRYGVSKYGIGRTIRVVLDLITIKFLMSYSTKPMQVFGKWGVISLGIGFFAGFMTVFDKVFYNLSVNRNGWALVCLLFLLTGMQFISMGLLGEISIRTYYESQKKPIYTVRDRIGWE